MEKLKSVLSRHKDDSESPTDTSKSGKIAGQGSHFNRTGGETYETDSAGYSLGGTRQLRTAGTDYESGSAAIGQTSTYSSNPLTKSDPVSSVADPQSTDPTTYRKPEAGSHNAGVPEGSALTAASTAFVRHHGSTAEGMPGAFPKQDSTNPYRTEHIDPRVDAHPRRQEPTTTSLSPSYGRNAALGAGAGLGAAAVASDSPVADRSHNITEPAPSTLTTTADPAARSAEYSQPIHEKGVGSTETPGVVASDPAPTTHETTPQTSNQTMFSRVLGAVGLGGATGATAASLDSHDHDTAVADTPDHPTTTTGVSSYTAPTQSGPGPSHHRKESIPTTAYPAGPNSPAPINPPVGGTAGAAPTEQQQHHYGRDVAIGAGAASVGAVGTREYEKSSITPESHTGQSSGLGSQPLDSTPRTTYHDATTTGGSTESHLHHFGSDAADTGIGARTGVGAGTPVTYEPRGEPGHTDRFVDKPYSSSTAGTTSTVPARTDTAGGIEAAPVSGTREHEHHYERDAALAGTAGAGVGALGVHEYDKQRAVPPTQPGSQPYTSQTQAGPSTGASTFTPYTSDNAASPATTATHQTPKSDDHRYGRDAAVGAGAAGAGAGAFGVHEYDKQRAVPPTQPGSQPYTSQTEAGPTTGAATAATQQPLKQEEHHYGRDAAVGAGAAGAGAYGAHELSKREEEKAEKEAAKQHAAHEKEIAKERAAHEKEIAKEEKAHEKEIAKERTAHEKEVEKEHKAQQKEEKKEHAKLEKSEKQQQKALEKEERKHEKELEKEEKHHEKEVAAAGVGAAGVGAGAYEAEKYHKPTETSDHPTSRLATADAIDQESYGHHEKEKKPNILKRIFKRRKNKDTGEDEDYESDEEDMTHGHHHGATAATTGAGAAGAGATYEAEKHHATHDHPHDPSDHSYEALSGGMQKPSYNPFKKDDPGLVSPTQGADKPHEAVTGLPYDPAKDPETAQRLGQHQGGGL